MQIVDKYDLGCVTAVYISSGSRAKCAGSELEAGLFVWNSTIIIVRPRSSINLHSTWARSSSVYLVTILDADRINT